MTVPTRYAGLYIPVKYFLSSYRALSDGRSGIRQLEEALTSSGFYVSDWKVSWVGTCALLRSAIDLFRADAKSCLVPNIKRTIIAEWHGIKKNEDQHAVFWKFLRNERDNILHQYEWRAYEAWMKRDGTLRDQPPTLLGGTSDDACPTLLMRGGPFHGRNSIELLKESADWVEARIFNAIREAGFDPDEERDVVGFQIRPRPVKQGLRTLLTDDGEDEPPSSERPAQLQDKR